MSNFFGTQDEAPRLRELTEIHEQLNSKLDDKSHVVARGCSFYAACAACFAETDCSQGVLSRMATSLPALAFECALLLLKHAPKYDISARLFVAASIRHTADVLGVIAVKLLLDDLLDLLLSCLTLHDQSEIDNCASTPCCVVAFSNLRNLSGMQTSRATQSKPVNKISAFSQGCTQQQYSAFVQSQSSQQLSQPRLPAPAISQLTEIRLKIESKSEAKVLATHLLDIYIACRLALDSQISGLLSGGWYEIVDSFELGAILLEDHKERVMSQRSKYPLTATDALLTTAYSDCMLENSKNFQSLCNQSFFLRAPLLPTTHNLMNFLARIKEVCESAENMSGEPSGSRALDKIFESWDVSKACTVLGNNFPYQVRATLSALFSATRNSNEVFPATLYGTPTALYSEYAAKCVLPNLQDHHLPLALAALFLSRSLKNPSDLARRALLFAKDLSLFADTFCFLSHRDLELVARCESLSATTREMLHSCYAAQSGALIYASGFPSIIESCDDPLASLLFHARRYTALCSGRRLLRCFHPHWAEYCRIISSFKKNAFDALKIFVAVMSSTLGCRQDRLFQRLFPFLIPLAIEQPYMSDAVEACTGISLQNLISHFFCYIVTHVVETAGHNDGISSFSQYEIIRALQKRYTIMADRDQSDLNKLFDEKRSAIALRLALLGGNCILLSDGQPDPVVASILQNRLLGLFHSAHNALVSKMWEPDQPSPQAVVEGLGVIFALVKNQLSVIGPQILVLLSDLSTQLPLLVMQCWIEFYRRCSQQQQADYIMPILATFVEKIDVQKYPEAALLALEFEQLNNGCLHLGPEIPCISPLEKLSRKVRRCKKENLKNTSPILRLLNYISNDDPAVAGQAGDELSSLLKTRSVAVDPIVLVRTLVAAFQRHPHLYLRISNCIGQLGAVDCPAREAAECLDVSDNVGLLRKVVVEHLLPTFRSASSANIQQACAYVFQELLNCLPEIMEAAAPEIQEFIKPLKKSDYRATVRGPADLLEPYHSEIPYDNWVCCLVIQMAKNLDTGVLKTLVQVLSPLLMYSKSSSLAAFLLPHVAYRVCCESEKGANQLFQEVTQVMQCAGLAPASQAAASLLLTMFEKFRNWSIKHQNRAESTPDSPFNLATRKRARTVRSSVSEPELQIEKWLSNVPNLLLATAAEAVGMLEAAVFYHEQASDRDVSSLHRVYVALGSCDYAVGIGHALSACGNEAVAFEHEIAHDFDRALVVYEKQIACTQESSTKVVDMLCQMGNFQAALFAASGLLQQQTDYAEQVADKATDVCWRLGSWDALDCIPGASTNLENQKYRAESETRVFGSQLPISLAALLSTTPFSESYNIISRKLKFVTLEQLRVRRNAASFVPFHIIADIENYEEQKAKTQGNEPNFAEDWLNKYFIPRLECTPNLFDVREPIVSAARCLLSRPEEKCSSKAAKIRLWLMSAKLALHDRREKMAYSCLMEATQSDLQGYQLRLSQLYMSKWRMAFEGPREALNYLRKLDFINNSNTKAATRQLQEVLEETKTLLKCSRPDKTSESYLESKMMLQLARWTQQTDDASAEATFAQFERAFQSALHWDRASFYAGRCIQKIMAQTIANEFEGAKDVDVWESPANFKYILMAIQFFCRTLLLSTKYVHQALPLVLQIWMQWGEALAVLDERLKRSKGSEQAQQQRKKFQKEQLDAFNLVHNHVTKVLDLLSPSVLMVGMPLVTSCLCTSNSAISTSIQKYILRLLKAYPSQCMWQLISSVNSQDEGRAKVAVGLIQTAFSGSKISASEKMVVRQIKSLSEMLVNLTSYKTESCESQEFDLTQHHGFKELCCPEKYNHVQMPTEETMRAALFLPPCSIKPSQQMISSNRTKRTFQNSLEEDLEKEDDLSTYSETFGDASFSEKVTIQKFDAKVIVMQSMLHPKQVCAIGSDGKKYRFLCKPKDDLRKDARVMEFLAHVNRLLQKDSSSSAGSSFLQPESTGVARSLRVRTYCVTPLRENSGIIEWVPDMVSIRAAVEKRYLRNLKVKVINNSINEGYKIQNIDKLVVAYEKVLQMYRPTQLSVWLAEQFVCPVDWFAARRNFTQTAALMSVVGHVLGLGDRHCDNILLDERTGEVMHVDYSYLFLKGLTLPTPERVPFRLTQNIIDAFGVVGYEGPFRRTCEHVLELLRAHSEALMITFDAFVHDPLLEWSRKQDSSSRANTQSGATSVEKVQQERQRQAHAVLEEIEKRLHGRTRGAALSPSGQVAELIEQATSKHNLARMFVGWLPHI